MRQRNRILWLMCIMATASLTIGGITIVLLYRTAFDEGRARLVEAAQSQARLIEAMARFDATYSNNYPEGAREATISQIVDAHNSYTGFGETGEFTLAKHDGDYIVFLLSHRHSELGDPKPVRFKSRLAEPMRRALSGLSGTVIGLDYRGEKVLAAYEPVGELNLGIVAKIDMAEVRRPFIRAGTIALGAALLVVLAGSGLFVRISNPIIRDLEERSANLTTANERLTREIGEREVAETLVHTEREKLRRILDGMKDGVCIVNEDYEVEYVNPVLEEEFKPVAGRKCYEYFHDSKEVCTRCTIPEVLEGKTVRWEWYSAKNEKTYDLIDTPLQNEDGTVSKLEIFRDITDLRRTSEALHESEERLRELNDTLEQRVAEQTAVAKRRARDLSRLSAELSRVEHRERLRLAKLLHDNLQQLLLAARLQLAHHGRDHEGPRRAEVEAIDELLGECLTSSRDLTMELSPPILLRGTLVEVFEWLGEWFGEKHRLTVAVDVQEEVPSTHEHVRVFFFHAVRELLLNVVKHSGVMEGRVSLFSRDGCLTVRVEDHGSGFDPDTVEQKLDRAQSFGLFNIREQLEALEGRMEIGSTPGGGACFELIVPVQAATEPRLGQIQTVSADTRQPAVEEPQSETGTIRLLVVDDHKVVREGLVGLLEREPDLEVVGQAADGEEAIRQAEALRPDVIILDVEMPTMDGVEATRQIKQRRPDAVIVGLSLHKEEAVARAMTEAGAAAYLHKHDAIEVLVEAIRGACGRAY